MRSRGICSLGTSTMAPSLLDVIGDALPLQVLDDRRGVLEREVGEQRRHLRRGGAHDQEREKRHQRDGDRAHGDDPSGTERSEKRHESLHGIPLQRRASADPARIAQFMVTVRLTAWAEGKNRRGVISALRRQKDRREAVLCSMAASSPAQLAHSTNAATLLSLGSTMMTLSSLTTNE